MGVSVWDKQCPDNVRNRGLFMQGTSQVLDLEREKREVVISCTLCTQNETYHKVQDTDSLEGA